VPLPVPINPLIKIPIPSPAMPRLFSVSEQNKINQQNKIKMSTNAQKAIESAEDLSIDTYLIIPGVGGGAPLSFATE